MWMLSRSHPNCVQTSRDSQRRAGLQSSQEVPTNNHSESEAESVTQNQTNQQCRKKRQQKRAAAKRKKTKTVIVTDNDSEAADDIVDFVQDSDNENAKVKKFQTEKISPLDNVRDYFEPPFHANKADKGEKMMYKCKWCTVVYKKGRGTNSNLYKHCDGMVDREPCLGQSKAIATGCKLPLTKKEIQNKDKDHDQDIQGSLKHAAFNNKVFNHLLMIWLVRYSLPWTQFNDFLLHVTFNYVQHGFQIYSWTWAATEAHQLYLNLQTQVVLGLQNLNSKSTLIHDIWTTKGNQHAFLGISVAYITKDWNFKISHLGMKYITSSHKGKLLAIPFANIIRKGVC
ncbi:hypothetical protein PCASD_11454 [Puccinia coronata f. sp. avenae]|uniref:BED-type domain-containing protein n=1 Tax=Puccinia coronata f. sp. avenae TaxID=200324 RepID=A0A2N5RXK1_9BASI|nr:hypothetical protein PCASD_26734 [Puccinia coronata f. sp. avenae]PLW43602.1 hypothetical protein PCASD_11454 [Puccinia coronata f. sp. avenae]